MGDADEVTDAPAASLSRRERTRARIAAVQAMRGRIAKRAERERRVHGSLDAVLDMYDRDAEVGGGIMAGALAYRLFIWMLPLALVAVAGLGIAADAAGTTPREAADSMGFAGLVSSSVAGAARSSARWYALLVGVPVLLLATSSVLRTLLVSFRLVWTELRSAVPRPTAKVTLQLAAVLLGFVACSALASAAREASGLVGLLAILVIPIPYGLLWLLTSARLPHGGVPWPGLIPGAIVFGIGVELLHLVTAYGLAPAAQSKQGTYGSLGIAAALLLGLFFVSRLIVATAVVNATLWERRARAIRGPRVP